MSPLKLARRLFWLWVKSKVLHRRGKLRLWHFVPSPDRSIAELRIAKVEIRGDDIHLDMFEPPEEPVEEPPVTVKEFADILVTLPNQDDGVAVETYEGLQRIASMSRYKIDGKMTLVFHLSTQKELANATD